MERIIWKYQSAQVFYVFEDKHIVHFWDDGVSIHKAAAFYKDTDTRLSPFEAPHIYPKALPLEFYKRIVLDRRLPISLTMEGDKLGSVKHTADYGYGGADVRSHKRGIIRQQTKLWVADDALLFKIEVDATPVDPRTALGDLRQEDRLPRTYGFEFAFPLDTVPELLNLTERERRAFQQNREDRSRPL